MAGAAEKHAEEQRLAALARSAEVDKLNSTLAGANNTNTAAMREELAGLGVSPANVEDQMALSVKFNAVLEKMYPGKARCVDGT